MCDLCNKGVPSAIDQARHSEYRELASERLEGIFPFIPRNDPALFDTMLTVYLIGYKDSEAITLEMLGKGYQGPWIR